MSWPDEDVAAALEWQEWKSGLCVCGVHRDEGFDPENGPQPGRGSAYRAEAYDCHVCAERDRAAWEDNKGRGANSPPLFGRYYAVTRRD